MTNRTPLSRIELLRRFVSPVAASVIVIVILISMSEERKPENSTDELLRVEEAFGDFPKEIRSEDGTWLQRRLVPIPTGQAELLGKSAFMSREYVRLRTFPGVTAILFMVYCAESRMMAGHHPPNCYPSSGWDLNDEQTKSMSVQRADGRRIDATIFQFARPNNAGEELAIVSGFFLGDGRFFPTLSAASESSRPSLLGGTGLFQFQILLQGGLSPVDVKQYGRELLSGIPSELFDEIISERNSSEQSSNSGGVS